MGTRRKRPSDYKKVTISLGDDESLVKARERTLASLAEQFKSGKTGKLSDLIQQIGDGRLRISRDYAYEYTNGRKEA